MLTKKPGASVHPTAEGDGSSPGARRVAEPLEQQHGPQPRSSNFLFASLQVDGPESWVSGASARRGSVGLRWCAGSFSPF
ncbi:hypothetical protein F2P81_017880 [Scophthalmus maximus]|uniref:Uncharacterized protein n=1 Tax=Scophthalmus maximus TaxID=52904 RepID=A0A6A4S8Y7_SCOMX|nr:hypothetical protein F2P81_017880 [Scophthalmus maximus]